MKQSFKYLCTPTARQFVLLHCGMWMTTSISCLMKINIKHCAIELVWEVFIRSVSEKENNSHTHTYTTTSATTNNNNNNDNVCPEPSELGP